MFFAWDMDCSEGKEFSMKKKKDRSNGITALYERLSRDDDNAGESNSITHQKQMLEDYAIKNGFSNLVHFTDDGWSGASFDRPAWNRLVEGVKSGQITAVIAKDLSRIGRDHLQVGFFTDILFREKEIRFIAINNSIDSDRQDSGEFAPFLNIMNEWYVRDTSKKIKAVLKTRGTSGNAHTSNIPPYGYLKDPDNPDHWIIDPEAAEVVRRIFRMTIEGKGPYTIARELAQDKIERPSYYLGKKGLGNHAGNYNKENPYAWRGNQVAALIARPEYIGKTVNFRTYKNSYKDKKQKKADKEDWVIFEGTQDAIVDTETWELAQKLRQNVRKADPLGEPNVLTGRIFCADCGAPMYNHRNGNPRTRVYYTAKGERRTQKSNPEDSFECSTYNLSRQIYGRTCSCHHISTTALKRIILETIQKTCDYVSLNEQDFVKSLQEASVLQNASVSDAVKRRIDQNEKRVHELDLVQMSRCPDAVRRAHAVNAFDADAGCFHPGAADGLRAHMRQFSGLCLRRYISTDTEGICDGVPHFLAARRLPHQLRQVFRGTAGAVSRFTQEKAEGGFRFGTELVHGVMGLQNCDIGIFRSGFTQGGAERTALLLPG